MGKDMEAGFAAGEGDGPCPFAWKVGAGFDVITKGSRWLFLFMGAAA